MVRNIFTCLPRKVKLAMLHAFYVGGLTFFSVLSSLFADNILSISEIYVALVSAFISYGLSFFTSMSIQTKNGNNEETKKKRIKIRKIKKIIRNKTSPDFWRKLNLVVHIVPGGR